jgi:serine/threonine-protein kinase
MNGTILHDRWRILSELGRGGMGEVYLAEHIELARKEALKILMPSLARDRQFVSRFRREARAVNRLRHPNIVALYDYGPLPDGRFFISMEYADGSSVSQIMRRAQPTPAWVTCLLAQLALAVHHAHSRDVVHRDLKPANLMVVANDTLKVLDFGMAKIVAPDVAETTPLSATNVIWGTPRYMSPERATGISDDPRSDLYSIGCIGFELLTGRPVFVGSSNDMLQAHMSRPPEPPSAIKPAAGIPPQLDDVILRLLEKRPEDRLQSAAELYALLRRVPGFVEQPAERRRRRSSAGAASK